MRNPIQAPAVSGNLFKSVSGKVRGACAAAALTLLTATSAMAVPITYTFEIDLTGHAASLGGVAVSGPLTITASGDTDNMTHNERWGGSERFSNMDDLVATFSVAGFGSFTTTAPFTVFTNADYYDDGTSYFVTGIRPNWGDYIGFDNVGYDLYDATSFGPGGTSASNDGSHFGWRMDNVSTTAGVFSIQSDASPLNATFTATVASANAVPEPDSLALFGSAGAALLLISRRRKQVTQAS